MRQSVVEWREQCGVGVRAQALEEQFGLSRTLQGRGPTMGVTA